MIHIESDNVNQAFIDIAKCILNKGKENSPRGLKTKEICDMFITIKNPEDGICSLDSRALQRAYLEGEMQFYLSGSLNVNDIIKFSSFWKNLADSNGTINSNYGFLALIEKFSGKSQLEWCIDSIQKDRYTRQSLINYNQPKHKYINNKDFPCSISQQFVVRDEKLDTITLMRSNDFIFGFTYDLPWFIYLQTVVSEKTNIEKGTYNHCATSFHVY